jgi:DNA-binding MarR family transcriptional regulator
MDDLQDSIDVCTADAMARYREIDREVEGIVDRIATINKYETRVFEETLAGFGLSHGEYKVLLRLAVAPPERRLSAGDLTRALMLSSGGMTNRLDGLEGAGLIRRLPDPNDRRGVLVELTDAGSDLIDRAVTTEAAKEIDLFQALAPEQRAELNALLRVVLRSLEDRFGPANRTNDVPVASIDPIAS